MHLTRKEKNERRKKTGVGSPHGRVTIGKRRKEKKGKRKKEEKNQISIDSCAVFSITDPFSSSAKGRKKKKEPGLQERRQRTADRPCREEGEGTLAFLHKKQDAGGKEQAPHLSSLFFGEREKLNTVPFENQQKRRKEKLSSSPPSISGKAHGKRERICLHIPLG